MADSGSDDDEDDDWLNSDRCKKTGRILKGRSGNYGGRPEKPKAETLPFEIAREVLAAGQIPIEVKENGRAKKLPSIQVVLRQLALAAAKGDKTATRLFMTHTNSAARTMEQRAQRQYERLGHYLKSLDEGKPWRIDQGEAEFLQRTADEAGIKITIRASDAGDALPPLTVAEIKAISQTPNLWRTLRDRMLPESDQEELIRRIIHAYRKNRQDRAVGF